MAESFSSTIPGQHIIFREMLMEGPVSRSLSHAFLEARQAFLSENSGSAGVDYNRDVGAMLLRIREIPRPSKVYLWFGYDVFCQVNLWSIVSWLLEQGHEGELLWVKPDSNKSCSYDNSKVALDKQIQSASVLSPAEQAEMVWALGLYEQKTAAAVTKGLKEKSLSGHMRQALVAVARDLPGANGLSELDLELLADWREDMAFSQFFQQFCLRHSIYGMGDLQVRQRYNLLMKHHKAD